MKILLTAMLLAATSMAAAQTTESTPPGDALQRHEVRISAGAYPIVYEPESGWLTPTPGQELELAKQYQGPKRTTGVYTLSYAYRIRKWFDVGVSLSYMGEYFTTYRQKDKTPISRHNTSRFSVMPTVRFTWLNRSLVRLYSSCGMGVAFLTGEEDHTSSHTVFAGQFTPIGISVGRSLFGFAEAGFGTHGALIVGIGYSFNSKKAQR